MTLPNKSDCRNSSLITASFALNILTQLITLPLLYSYYKQLKYHQSEFKSTSTTSWYQRVTSSAVLYQLVLRFMALALNLIMQQSHLVAVVLECFVLGETFSLTDPILTLSSVFSFFATSSLWLMTSSVIFATMHRYERLDNLTLQTPTSLKRLGGLIVFCCLMNIGYRVALCFPRAEYDNVDAFFAIFYAVSLILFAAIELVLNILMIRRTLFDLKRFNPPAETHAGSSTLNHTRDQKTIQKRKRVRTRLFVLFSLLTLVDVLSILSFILLIFLLKGISTVYSNILYCWLTFHLVIAFRLLDMFKHKLVQKQRAPLLTATELSTVDPIIDSATKPMTNLAGCESTDFKNSTGRDVMYY